MSVLLVATGGTIASRPTDAGVTAVLDGAALLERAGITEGVDVVEAGRGPSWGLDPGAVESIARTTVAAAASGKHEGVVVTQDALVEDVHFRLGWTSWRDLGYKAAAVNLSDLAAACAVPDALVVSLALQPSIPLDAVVELYEGLNETGVAVRGGDLTRADRVYLSVTAAAGLCGLSVQAMDLATCRPTNVVVL